MSFFQKKYDSWVEEFGPQYPMSIDAGLDLCEALRSSHRTIEAERLLANIIVMCRRVHGIDHDSTQIALSLQERVKE